MSRENTATVRWLVGLGCRVLAGVLLLLVAIRGVSATWAVDLRANTMLTLLYCLLPTVNFLAFLGVRRGSLRIGLQAVMTVGFIAAYVALGWRTCASFGYCTTVEATVWTTLKSTSVVQLSEGLLLSAVMAGLDCKAMAAVDDRGPTE